MSLAEELHMRRAFSSVQEEAFVAIFATWDLLAQHTQQRLGAHGLSLAQYNVLRILRGVSPQGLPLMTIAKRMVARYPNITRLTDRLETNGWIRRERSTEDRRVVRAFVSDAGLELLGRIDPEVERLTVELMRGSSPEGLGSLLRTLEELRQPLRQGIEHASPFGNGVPPRRMEEPRRARGKAQDIASRSNGARTR